MCSFAKTSPAWFLKLNNFVAVMSAEFTARDSISAQCLKSPILEGVAPASSFRLFVLLHRYKHIIVGDGDYDVVLGLVELVFLCTETTFFL